jgi:hypothetical protein
MAWFLKSTLSTSRSDPSNALRTSALSMLSLPAGRQGLTLSGDLTVTLKTGVWPHRTCQIKRKRIRKFHYRRRLILGVPSDVDLLER